MSESYEIPGMRFVERYIKGEISLEVYQRKLNGMIEYEVREHEKKLKPLKDAIELFGLAVDYYSGRISLQDYGSKTVEMLDKYCKDASVKS